MRRAAAHEGRGAVGGIITKWQTLARLVRSVVLPRSPAALLPALALACSKPDGTVNLPQQSALRGDDPPVMLNAESPVVYPPALLAEGIGGKVILRMYVDTAGQIAKDSTRIAESSGYPALDSAALRAAPEFRFAPALHNGSPVASMFLQPVHFRHPQAGGTTP